MECPYHRDAPISVDGMMVWGAFLDNHWRLKIAGLGGVTGIDLDPARRTLERSGMPPEIAEELLAACEYGALKAINAKDDEDGTEGA
jgi:hypothetical protein